MDSLLDLLDHAAGEYGARRFALDASSSADMTFAQLKLASENVASYLCNQLGVQPGQHVALMLPNTLSFLPAYFGVLRAGAVAVPINARLKAEELAFILADSDACVLMVHPRTWASASEALGKESGIGSILAVDFEKANLPQQAHAFEEVLAGKGPAPERPGYSRNDVAAIIYTSGTTGRPKGAMLTHGNILFNVESTKASHGALPSDVHLLSVPLFHVTGLNTILPTALDQGAQVIISAMTDPEDLLGVVGRNACTTFIGVPTTFYLLTNLKDDDWPLEKDDLKALRLICYSGAPMAEPTIKALRERFPGVALHNFFGLTETTSVSTVLPDDQALGRAESVGLPPPGLELGIVDEDDNLLPTGEVGELVIKGPSVFKGYYKREEASAEALRAGWFHTGDTALLDPEGYLFLKGRKKELIIVAAENVYPIEVENLLCAHPDVQEAAVFGRPNKVFGEVVEAAVVPRSGREQQVKERELKHYLAERLAAFKVPRKIRILDKLPRNPSGKVMKRDLI